MITRYALGPRITVIGRERVKQGLKNRVAAKCAFSPGGRTKGPRGRDRGFHGFVRRQQRGRRVCPAARPPPRRGHAVPQTGSLSQARCRLSRQRAGPLDRHELRGGPAKVKLLPRVRQQGARPRGPWARRPPAGRGVSSPGPGERRPLRFTDASSPRVSTSPRTHSGPGSVGTREAAGPRPRLARAGRKGLPSGSVRPGLPARSRPRAREAAGAASPGGPRAST